MGTLYLVATPIGNLGDITLRALEVLQGVDRVAAEDTRHTGRLLKHHGISAPLISYHEHSEPGRLSDLLQVLEQGSLALVSDAGSPLLSDPGYELVRAALDAGHQVIPIPGPAAPITALTASGLPSDSFLFVGYLPRKKSERRARLEEWSRMPYTLVAFEVPHRLRESLSDLVAVFGEERLVTVCRELTKLHEEILRGSLKEMLDHFEAEQPRGEITLVIAGADREALWGEAQVKEALARLMEKGVNPSQAAREVAQQSGWDRREVYRITLEGS